MAVLEASDNTTYDVPQEVIIARNMLANERIAADKLRSIDVKGDGNCFYRALSVCLTGKEDDYVMLRQLTVDYLASISADDLANISPALAAQLRHQLDDAGRDGAYVGEAMIPVVASWLGRTICVYNGTGYEPTRPYHPQHVTVMTSSPLSIAFYEPGHYRAVLPASSSATASLN